jgi:hypothetical protein
MLSYTKHGKFQTPIQAAQPENPAKKGVLLLANDVTVAPVPRFPKWNHLHNGRRLFRTRAWRIRKA